MIRHRPKHVKKRSRGSWTFLMVLVIVTALAVWAAITSTPTPMR